ncbi:MAG TPA: ABC transporter ATP-binding protein [Kofleriaceae bacterium]|jgi:ABC-type multidrug transport system fused ATPase/permease subunit
MGPLFAASRGKILALGITAFLGGLAEASVLLLVIKTALVVAAGQDVIEIAKGPLQATLHVRDLLLLAVGVSFVRFGLQVYAGRLAARMSTDVITSSRRDTFSEFMDASWELQSKEEDGHVQDLMTRYIGRTSTAVLSISTGLNALFNFLALLISALVLNLPAAAIIVAAVTVLFFLLRPLTKKVGYYAARQLETGRNYAKSMVEVTGMAMEARTFGVLDAIKQRLVELDALEATPYFRGQFIGKLLPSLYQTIAVMVLLGGMAVLHTFFHGQLTSLAAIVLILVRALNYSEQVQMIYHRVVEILPAAEHLESERRRFRESHVEQTGREVGKLAALTFENVRFQYTADRAALDDVSFTLEAGETVGLIGPSGSGKSTLVQLLLRLRVPTSGRFLVNGEEAREQEIRSWYRRIAFVPQDSKLLSASIADNIRFFRDGITDAQVERAARLAHMHDEIVTWPNGYATVVGPRGNAISGGQRQRISLARALVAQPDLIVLDEPTSALDMQSEALVHETLEALKGKVTLIVIAHRMSTINICDRIMVLGEGKLQAFDHRERLETGNQFYRQALELSQSHRPAS